MTQDNNEILGLEEIQAIADDRRRRVASWEEFSKQVKARIMSNTLLRQPREEVEALLKADRYTDLFFKGRLAITEVLDPPPHNARKDDLSTGYWDITYNCLAASSGDFAPFSPPNDETYYRSREQALIAAVGWLSYHSDAAYELLMRQEGEQDFICPQCGFNPGVDEEDG